MAQRSYKLLRARLPGIFAGLVLSMMTAGVVCAQDLPVKSGLGALAEHDHPPILVRSRPVIERLPVSVVEPADLCVSVKGNIYIADRRAKVVFRLTPAGQIELAAAGIDGLHRILVDSDETLYVLTNSSGSGRIMHVASSGLTVELHQINFSPVGFARDDTNAFVVASASGRSVRIDDSGLQTELATVSEPIVDIAMNSADQTHVLLRSGRIVFLGIDGASSTSGHAPSGATRLFALPEGKLAVLHQEAEQRPFVRSVVENADEVLSTPFAQVPSGTVAVAFDSLGNICLANPDLHAVTRVTSRFAVPCPHCGRSTKIIFSTDEAALPETSAGGRSF